MSNPKTELKNISKFLSYVLRHCPEDIDLDLDSEGWACISELISKAQPKIQLTQSLIVEVVSTSDKQRFKISDDGLKIRANQGHSIKVDLNLTLQEPPAALYHGTATRFLDSILDKGLISGKRHHVHLSTDIATAIAVGQRYGKPTILKVNSASMFKQGYKFYISDNNVWLVDNVPPKYLSLENKK
ncbi:RNA 2'-phosphotransferase [Pseudoalteromonas luteoviolacea]|uniref:RNA 2'-phosphotransferase n=1 Tax=Pseudoalteromonas luteoviolacea TaxID=43657 RepID=UPI00114FAB37|nr:RNA 2'-phosphotransferase [Pseudoalteromonas luteoviolacea]TQF67813.1 RNA 2'-phosphotransferase [Pseudoalteromonas luteoviolacea]